MHSTAPGSHRVAIYARYSSQLQKPTSIEDQIRLCRQQAEANGHDVVRVHIDRSATATTRHSRPGLRDLLRDAERRIIDFVYAEALDRLSRDQEDMPGIYKRLKYWNVQLFTLQEGEIEPIHIFVGGFMNHAWVENLANKTRRGQIGAVHAGRIPGGLCYGYRTANRIDENGRPVRGLREVDPHQAAVVRRIYGLYADGSSAREIAGILNGEGEPGPRGRAWGQSTINGHRTRRNGILNNELYRGRIVYGRQNFIRDPDTGKRQARPVDPSEWIVEDAPDLQIVNDTLWNRVQTRRQAGHDRRRSSAPRAPLPLTGVLRCGVCGGPMTIVNKRRYACHAHREKRTCDNPRGIDARRIEDQACNLLSAYVLEHPDVHMLVHEAAERSHARRAEIAAEVDDKETRIENLIDSIETGRASRAAHLRVLGLEQEIAALKIELQDLAAVPCVGPGDIAERIQQRLSVLDAAITDTRPDRERRHRALLAVAHLIERIDLTPLPKRGQVDLAVRPRTDALVALALSEEWRFDPPPPTSGS